MYAERDKEERRRRVWAFKVNGWLTETMLEPVGARHFEHPNRYLIQQRASNKRRAA